MAENLSVSCHNRCIIVSDLIVIYVVTFVVNVIIVIAVTSIDTAYADVCSITVLSITNVNISL